MSVEMAGSAHISPSSGTYLAFGRYCGAGASSVVGVSPGGTAPGTAPGAAAAAAGARSVDRGEVVRELIAVDSPTNNESIRSERRSLGHSRWAGTAGATSGRR